MKLAGVMTRSAGYPVDEPAAMVYLALYEVTKLCSDEAVRPVGAFEMAVATTHPMWPDGPDVAVRWEFTPDDGWPYP